MYFRILKNLSFYLQKEKRKLFSAFFQQSYVQIDEIPKISAYLSIYNDADILDKTLDSIREYVGELIVVDGAYTWNASYLKSIGLNPEQSEAQVYKKLDDSKIPYKTVKGIWKNEVEKRIAGYEATSSRYVMRIDADEVIFFKTENLKSFFCSECAVAEMYMPNYAAPGLVIRGKSLLDRYRMFPRQVCLFDRTLIGAGDHLKYLWLVLTADELPKNSSLQKIYPVFEKPIAFCAHLTNWRSVDSSMLRSSFYTMNWMRKHGAPWVKSLQNSCIEKFDHFFEKISPKYFLEVMRNSRITQGDIELRENEILSESPLTKREEEEFSTIYDDFKSSLGAQSLLLSDRGGIALKNYPFYIDISSSDLENKLFKNGKMTIQFDEKIDEVRVELKLLQSKRPFAEKFDLTYDFDGVKLVIDMTKSMNRQELLRKTVEIIPKSILSNQAWVNFKVLTA